MASKKEFVEFKKRFLLYQEKFGLMGWQVYFEHKPLAAFSEITALAEDRMATVALSSKNPDVKLPDVTVKHEALHLLLAKYCSLAHDRYVRGGQIHAEEEELVIKLCRLIPDI